MYVHIGTSGYNYPEWRGVFYPDRLPAAKMFAFYSERFTTVEINYTFYRLPAVTTIEKWRAQAPERFHYVLKAPRRITHDRRLEAGSDLLAAFCENARALGPHLGPLLFQLPPTFRCDVARLSAFLAEVPGNLRTAFEFRHDSWLTDEVYEALAARGAALCIADTGDRSTPLRATARHGYFRLRDEGYTADDLQRWADRLTARSADWDDAFVFFKHEEDGKGPEFAAAFRALLEGRSEVTLA